MRISFPIAAIALLAACWPSASAASGEALAGCVTLSPEHQGARFGSQYLLVRDNDRHYRIGFSGSCEAISRSAAVTISTGGEHNRLCAVNSVVSSKHDRCAVRHVELIDADDYARYAKKRRG